MRRDLRITREYPHPPELVWRALTDPALIAEWLMQNDFRPELGHRFKLRTDPAPGFDGIVRCEVLEFDPPTTMRWSWRGGPIDTVVAFRLEDTLVFGRRGTRLVVEHTGFEGLPAILVSFLLGAGNRTIYGRTLPAVLDRLARSGAAPPADARRGCHEQRGLWWVLAQALGPIIRRAAQKRANRG
ncbi:SRPBCC domain-containing protein [Sorangium sp. So ce726]|uniref:SRPBCC family protein n=1 Tax=Sorangium sp. So ce726 TaxID=3133319 RepID=UPI003F636C5F